MANITRTMNDVLAAAMEGFAASQADALKDVGESVEKVGAGLVAQGEEIKKLGQRLDEVEQRKLPDFDRKHKSGQEVVVTDDLLKTLNEHDELVAEVSARQEAWIPTFSEGGINGRKATAVAAAAGGAATLAVKAGLQHFGIIGGGEDAGMGDNVAPFAAQN